MYMYIYIDYFEGVNELELQTDIHTHTHKHTHTHTCTDGSLSKFSKTLTTQPIDVRILFIIIIIIRHTFQKKKIIVKKSKCYKLSYKIKSKANIYIYKVINNNKNLNTSAYDD